MTVQRETAILCAYLSEAWWGLARSPRRSPSPPPSQAPPRLTQARFRRRSTKCPNLKSWRKKTGQGEQSIAADPVVRDAKSKALEERDYHLTKGSPAIDAAAASFVDTDLDADVRPMGEAPDMGADEYVGEPKLKIEPGKLKLKAAIGDCQEKELTIENRGNGALSIWSATSSNPTFRVVSPPLPEAVAPKARVDLEVEFRPETKRRHKGKLLIRSSDPDRPEVRVKLTGKVKK